METVSIIATHTPVYVWLVLALLLFLGVRRLRPRRTHLALAALAPLGFFTWSVLAAGLLFFGGDRGTIAVVWGVAFLTGVLSGPIRTVGRPKHIHGWIFEYAATALPLTLYMLLWLTRYGLGIWAGFVPAMADTLGMAGLALSALTAGRTLSDFVPPLATALRVQKAGIATV